jgi:hypothetical protein
MPEREMECRCSALLAVKTGGRQDYPLNEVTEGFVELALTSGTLSELGNYASAAEKFLTGKPLYP